jgi:hypothetical protein
MQLQVAITHVLCCHVYALRHQMKYHIISCNNFCEHKMTVNNLSFQDFDSRKKLMNLQQSSMSKKCQLEVQIETDAKNSTRLESLCT